MGGHSVAADLASANPPGQIIVTGSADVSLPPSTARFSIGVSTRAPSAAAAGEQNARLSRDVLAALDRAGLARAEIKGSNVTVNRRWEYDSSGQRSKASAFEANHTIEIETHRLAQVGVFIDEALAAGATSTSDVSFSADRIDEARREALSEAVAAARGDAEALARAGGGTLGELQLLSTEREPGYPGGLLNGAVVSAARMSAPPPVPTTVLPTEITVSASVTGRWRFVPPPAAR